jgi:hypothetical protein
MDADRTAIPISRSIERHQFRPEGLKDHTCNPCCGLAWLTTKPILAQALANGIPKVRRHPSIVRRNIPIRAVVHRCPT